MKNPKPKLNRTGRMRQISEKFSNYDVVCLQEMWVPEDQRFMIEAGAKIGLVHSHVYRSGLIGTSGMLTLSRFPILDVHFHRYRVNGRILRIDHGDHHAGKGVGFARIKIDDERTVSVFNTHTIASYVEHTKDDIYYADRVSQMWELARIIQLITRFDPNPIVACGDFNCEGDSLEYRFFKQLTGLKDSNDLNDDPGYTHDDSVDGKSKRLDYVFYRPSEKFDIKTSTVVMKDKFYSDHAGVEAIFDFSKRNSPKTKKEEKEEKDVFGEVLDNIRFGIQSVSSRRNATIAKAFALILLFLVINVYLPIVPKIILDCILIVVVVELFIAAFMLGNDISGLEQIYQEMKYTLNIDKK
eukprot:TRINITY_DN3352_c0_g1_i1.p1 TRINITY_DN3352_c0_g1~~TRINITY_DN3352_c0_g1_i1.p1  ORF type:complete len:370 (+),score=84.79 TRINITY_DN3352_c0_g1_i1:46-1110(+)